MRSYIDILYYSNFDLLVVTTCLTTGSWMSSEDLTSVPYKIIYLFRAGRILTRRMTIANKKVCQRQKLISIIDYDVCMTFY